MNDFPKTKSFGACRGLGLAVFSINNFDGFMPGRPALRLAMWNGRHWAGHDLMAYKLTHFGEKSRLGDRSEAIILDD